MEDARDRFDLVPYRRVAHWLSIMHNVGDGMHPARLAVDVIIDKVGMRIRASSVGKVDKSLNLHVGRVVGVRLQSSPHLGDFNSVHVKPSDDAKVVTATL